MLSNINIGCKRYVISTNTIKGPQKNSIMSQLDSLSYLTIIWITHLPLEKYSIKKKQVENFEPVTHDMNSAKGKVILESNLKGKESPVH